MWFSWDELLLQAIIIGNVHQKFICCIAILRSGIYQAITIITMVMVDSSVLVCCNFIKRLL